MSIIEPAKVEGPVCRNCGCKRTMARCLHCGSHTGSFPVVKSTTNLERRRTLNAGIRRIYAAMLKSGSLRRKESR